MKLSTVIFALPLARALVVPNTHHTQIPWLDGLVSSLSDLAGEDWGPLSSDDFASMPEDALEALQDSFLSFLGHDKHPPTDTLTAWQILEKTAHARKFAELVKKVDGLVDTLNSTSLNHTLFVPTDEALENASYDGDDLEGFLKYHIIPGNVPVRDMWHRNTLPTLHKERLLGDEPQRVRVRFGLRGVHVNVYSRVIVSDVPAINGVLHAINHALPPPSPVGKTIANYPAAFSTLLYAYDKTDFVKFIHGVKMTGSTVFAPSNAAFSKLGRRTLKFLFETERGREILTAILKYHIVPDTTFYSDAVYGKLSEKSTSLHSTHYELKTLYDGTALGVDVWRWGGWTRLTVNGDVGVSFADGVSKNGVLHVVDHVLLPPCPDGHEEGSVEMLEAVFGGEVGEL